MQSHSHTFTAGPWRFKDDFDLVVGPDADPSVNPIAIIKGNPEEAFGNAILISSAPNLFFIAQRLLYDINGLNATMSATDRKYAASPLCAKLTELIRDASENMPFVKEGTR